MTDYVKATNFAAKDALLTGNPLKLLKGTELGTEYDNIATASTSKSNKISSATDNSLVSMDASGDIKDSTITTDGAGTITADLVGDVTGNADTVTTNANLTGIVTSVGNATSIAAGAITATHLGDDSVSFSSEINNATLDSSWSLAGSGTQIIPAGVYNINIPMGVILGIFTGATGWRSVAGHQQVVSDGASVRVQETLGSAAVVNYRRLFS